MKKPCLLMKTTKKKITYLAHKSAIKSRLCLRSLSTVPMSHYAFVLSTTSPSTQHTAQHLDADAR